MPATRKREGRNEHPSISVLARHVCDQGTRDRVGDGRTQDDRKAAVMSWNDELERLTLHVNEYLGADVFKGCLSRAIAAVTIQGPKRQMTPHDDIDDLLSGGPSIVSSDGCVYSIDAFYNALLRELRQVARPQ